jgi:uncharacterized RDD family membrane protein YckC
VAQDAVPSGRGQESYPGQRLGLTPSGRGSLATWGNRITALVVDWAASMAVAVLLFGSGVLTSDGWRAWMILAVFFVESTILSALAGGSFGQLLAGLGIARLDAKPLGFVRAVIRAALVCLVVPALVVGADRRGLHDVAVGTMVIKRR